jgi:predicted esterase YcpF (UPF0227 family)
LIEKELLIASSYGAFQSLFNSDVNIPMILVNPCLKPVNELSKITELTSNEISLLSNYEQKLPEMIHFHRNNTVFVISEKDDVIGSDNVKEHINLLLNNGIESNKIEILFGETAHKINQDILKKIKMWIFAIFHL